MEKLAGYVEHIIYRNTDNGYTVLNLVSGEDEITCVGIFSTIAEGENIEATGDYTDHPTYGTQFKVVSFEEKAPEDQEAIERYLAMQSWSSPPNGNNPTTLLAYNFLFCKAQTN